MLQKNEEFFLGNSKKDFFLNVLKIAIICFVGITLIASIEPFYEGRDSYVHALASINLSNGILERILTLDPNLILPEQFNPIDSKYYSAKKLTWNYSELYQLYNLLN